MKEYRKSADNFLKADKISPSWAQNFYAAWVFNHEAKYAKAFQLYEKALKLAKHSSIGKERITLDYTFYISTCTDESLRESNKKRALELAKSLLKMKVRKEKTVYKYSNASAAFSINGDFKKAISLAKQALKHTSNENLKTQLNERIELYKKNKIWIIKEH